MQEELTQDMIEAAGNYYIDAASDGHNPGYHGHVYELSSWKYPDFRNMVAGLLKKAIMTSEQEAAIRKQREDAKRSVIEDRLKVIPDLYLKPTNKEYAKEARAAIRRWATLQRAPKPQGSPLRSLYVYGQSGRGKSHYAGKLSEQLVVLITNLKTTLGIQTKLINHLYPINISQQAFNDVMTINTEGVIVGIDRRGNIMSSRKLLNNEVLS